MHERLLRHIAGIETIKMSINQNELHKLLSLLEKHIDPEHSVAVDARYLRSLNYQNIDGPPLVIQAAFGKTLELPSPQ